MKKTWKETWKETLMLGITGIFLLTGCQNTQETQNTTSQDETQETSVTQNTNETKITGEGSFVTVTGSGASAAGGVVTITKGGSYRLSGSIDDGKVIIDAGKEDEIVLILDGVAIHSSDSSAIYGAQSGLITLTLEDHTENSVSDASSYVYANQTDDEPNAAIFSKDDLVLEGTGSLIVNGNYQEGIRSKDNLAINSGTYDITAVNDGIKGKDSVEILDGNITINAGGDGIQSNNDTDESKGYVKIAAGNFDITAEKKGIQAETMAEIQGGTINIVSEDDSLHSNGDIKIAGGILTLTSGDDAIHADNQVLADDGEIHILKSYEGIEGLCIDINGGIINITAEDDGLNSAGGNDASGNTSKWGDDPFATTEGAYIKITGGQLLVNASGDGVDSNGDFIMEGGTVIVEGPINNGNGTLDYNGEGIISGGTFIGTGSSGMLQSFSQDSTQPVMVIYYSENQAAGAKIELMDSEGAVLLTETPSKEFTSLILSTPDFEEGKSYQVHIGDNVTELTIEGIVTQSGTGSGMNHGMGRGQGRGVLPGGGENAAGEQPQPPEGMDGLPEGGMGGERKGGNPPQKTSPDNRISQDEPPLS